MKITKIEINNIEIGFALLWVFLVLIYHNIFEYLDAFDEILEACVNASMPIILYVSIKYLKRGFKDEKE